MTTQNNEGPQPPATPPAKTVTTNRKRFTGGGAVPGEHVGHFERYTPPAQEDPDVALIREYKAASTQEKIRRWPHGSEARRQLDLALSRRGAK